MAGDAKQHRRPDEFLPLGATSGSSQDQPCDADDEQDGARDDSHSRTSGVSAEDVELVEQTHDECEHTLHDDTLEQTGMLHGRAPLLHE